MSYDDELKVIEKYKEGLSLAAVGEMFNVNFVTIRNVLKGHNVERRRQGNKSKIHDKEFTDKVIRMYKSGISQERIAEQLSSSQKTISSLLKFNGIYCGVKSGANHPNWKGGRYITNGYVSVSITKDSPYSSMAIANGHILEHRLMMAQHLKRPLESHETVHHINGDTQDNRIENLQLRHGKHGKHQVFVCCNCGSHNVKSTTL